MKEITVLHVFPDQKFFDWASNVYDDIKCLRNLYYLYTSDLNYEFKYIKNVHKVKLIHNRSEYLKLFSSADIDIILFHSGGGRIHKYFKYIDKKKIVIWWSWGGDIYNKDYNILPPLIKHELYKPMTKAYIEEHHSILNLSFLLKQSVRLLLYPYYLFLRNKSVRRVDYFIPCMPLDYKLLKEQCKFFRAEIFPYGWPEIKYDFVFHEKPGNILIGNSLTYTNNHLDIFDKIHSYQLKMNRKYIVPVSYGWGQAFNNNPDNLITQSKINSNDVLWLKDYLDKDEYFKLFNNVTHAIYGVLRQQALDNIYACFRKGVKVYLYKDSVIADQLKENGYIFYTIDDDLTELSLSECLSKEEAMHNYNLFMLMIDNNMDLVENKFQDIIRGRSDCQNI